LAKCLAPLPLALSPSLLHKGPDIVPIPGTKPVKYLEENVAAASISLDTAQRSTLDEALAPEKISGLATTDRDVHDRPLDNGAGLRQEREDRHTLPFVRALPLALPASRSISAPLLSSGPPKESSMGVLLCFTTV
jgi:hypothetical protein